jgi:hypothetical protein
MKRSNFIFMTVWLVYLALVLGLAGIEKIISHKVPEWFLTQFSSTFIGFNLSSLKLSFYFISMLELTSSLLLILFLSKFSLEIIKKGKQSQSLSKPTILILKFALLSVYVTFLALSFGQRLSGKYDSAALILIYPLVTVLIGSLFIKEIE